MRDVTRYQRMVRSVSLTSRMTTQVFTSVRLSIYGDRHQLLLQSKSEVSRGEDVGIQWDFSLIYPLPIFMNNNHTHHGRIQRGGQGVRTPPPPPPPPPGIARLLFFAMLKFPSDPFWEFGPSLRKFSGSAHAHRLDT